MTLLPSLLNYDFFSDWNFIFLWVHKSPLIFLQFLSLKELREVYKISIYSCSDPENHNYLWSAIWAMVESLWVIIVYHGVLRPYQLHLDLFSKLILQEWCLGLREKASWFLQFISTEYPWWRRCHSGVWNL